MPSLTPYWATKVASALALLWVGQLASVLPSAASLVPLVARAKLALKFPKAKSNTPPTALMPKLQQNRKKLHQKVKNLRRQNPAPKAKSSRKKNPNPNPNQNRQNRNPANPKASTPPSKNPSAVFSPKLTAPLTVPNAKLLAKTNT